MKLFAENDVMISRIRHSKGSHQYLLADEMKRVQELVGETGFYLYHYYRCAEFHESADFKDQEVGDQIGWGMRKVQRYRLELEKAGLLLMEQQGKNLKVFIGEEVVALHNAGLPAKVVDGSVFLKLKKQLNITTPAELLERLPILVQAYKDSCR